MKTGSARLLVTASVFSISVVAANAADPASWSSSEIDRYHPILTTGQHALVLHDHLYLVDGKKETLAPNGVYRTVDGRVFIVGPFDATAPLADRGKGLIMSSTMPSANPASSTVSSQAHSAAYVGPAPRR